MTRDELIEKLKSLKTSDLELGHVDADNALIEYINDAEITAAYNALRKLYA